jgi:hypothetical protein
MRTNKINGELKYIIYVYQTPEQIEGNLANLEFTEPVNGFLNSTVYKDSIFNPKTQEIILPSL